MPELLKTLKPDVLFSPHHYLPLLTGCPSVCVIHDLGYLNFSGQFRKKDYWQLSIWSAISVIISKYIICPSESVRKDIVRHYSFAKKKVLVIPHGYDSDLFNASISEKNVRRVVKKYRIGENYILFLSTLKPSKNIEGLIVAYSTIRKRYDYKLVIAGKKGWMYQSVFKKVKDLGLENDVVFTDYVPEEDKPGLIKGARVFTLPSYWEGFGMDILNAKACGVPVVVSNRGSLPEVAGSAGIYVEPTNIDSIANGITSVLEMTEVDYNRLSLKCIQEAKKYSWEKAANQTLSAIIDAVNKEN